MSVAWRGAYEPSEIGGISVAKGTPQGKAHIPRLPKLIRDVAFLEPHFRNIEISLMYTRLQASRGDSCYSTITESFKEAFVGMGLL